ncbi:hypothetical protein C8F01DRAFT_1091577 [Mycena amicta]|nr:hypothetical protein C8F01DRAFT_1091577 [Mycena amicta]
MCQRQVHPQALSRILEKCQRECVPAIPESTNGVGGGSSRDSRTRLSLRKSRIADTVNEHVEAMAKGTFRECRCPLSIGNNSRDTAIKPIQYLVVSVDCRERVVGINGEHRVVTANGNSLSMTLNALQRKSRKLDSQKWQQVAIKVSVMGRKPYTDKPSKYGGYEDDACNGGIRNPALARSRCFGGHGPPARSPKAPSRLDRIPERLCGAGPLGRRKFSAVTVIDGRCRKLNFGADVTPKSGAELMYLLKGEAVSVNLVLGQGQRSLQVSIFFCRALEFRHSTVDAPTTHELFLVLNLAQGMHWQ